MTHPREIDQIVCFAHRTCGLSVALNFRLQKFGPKFKLSLSVKHLHRLLFICFSPQNVVTPDVDPAPGQVQKEKPTSV